MNHVKCVLHEERRTEVEHVDVGQRIDVPLQTVQPEDHSGVSIDVGADSTYGDHMTLVLVTLYRTITLFMGRASSGGCVGCRAIRAFNDPSERRPNSRRSATRRAAWRDPQTQN